MSLLLKGVKEETYGVIKKKEGGREITTCRRDKKFDVDRKKCMLGVNFEVIKKGKKRNVERERDIEKKGTRNYQVEMV